MSMNMVIATDTYGGISTPDEAAIWRISNGIWQHKGSNRVTIQRTAEPRLFEKLIEDSLSSFGVFKSAQIHFNWNAHDTSNILVIGNTQPNNDHRGCPFITTGITKPKRKAVWGSLICEMLMSLYGRQLTLNVIDRKMTVGQMILLIVTLGKWNGNAQAIMRVKEITDNRKVVTSTIIYNNIFNNMQRGCIFQFCSCIA